MIALLRNQDAVARFNHICTGFTSTSDGITLHFSNQPDAAADILIASDGVKSRIRHALYEQKGLDVKRQQARYAEWIAWRGLIAKADFLTAMGKETSLKQMLLGHRRHILHFPVRGGDMINIVRCYDPTAALVLNCGSQVGFVQDQEHAKLGHHTGPWAEERPKEELLEDFKTFRPEALALLRAIKKPSIWGIFECPELEVASGERVVLIGAFPLALLARDPD